MCTRSCWGKRSWFTVPKSLLPSCIFPPGLPLVVYHCLQPVSACDSASLRLMRTTRDPVWIRIHSSRAGRHQHSSACSHPSFCLSRLQSENLRTLHFWMIYISRYIVVMGRFTVTCMKTGINSGRGIIRVGTKLGSTLVELKITGNIKETTCRFTMSVVRTTSTHQHGWIKEGKRPRKRHCSCPASASIPNKVHNSMYQSRVVDG